MTNQEMMDLCTAKAAAIVQAKKYEYPGCEGAMNLANDVWTLLGEDGGAWLSTNPGNYVSTVAVATNGKFYNGSTNSRIYYNGTIPGGINVHASGMLILVTLNAVPTGSVDVDVGVMMGTFMRGNNGGGVDVQNIDGTVHMTIGPSSATQFYITGIADETLPA
jgi:hypothetical protein